MDVVLCTELRAVVITPCPHSRVKIGDAYKPTTHLNVFDSVIKLSVNSRIDVARLKERRVLLNH